MHWKRPWPQAEKNECLLTHASDLTELQLEQLEKPLKSYSVAYTNDCGTISCKFAPGQSGDGQLFVLHRS